MQKCRSILFIILVHCAQRTVTSKRDCSVSVSDLPDVQPLILNNNFGFLYPDDGIVLRIRNNKKLIISCTNEDNYSHELEDVTTPYINITCIEGDTFAFNGQKLKFEEITCKKSPPHIARYTHRKCGGKYKEIEIGFEIGKFFLRTITVCFDEELQTTVFTHFKMTKWIEQAKSGMRVSWISDGFYDLDKKSSDQVYSRKSQRKQINELLGLTPQSKNIIKDKGEQYLARGHLAAKADFFYVNGQKSTFHIVNAAPQWQVFNNGNWKRLETDIRRLASQRNKDLHVYSGTYDILSMANKATRKEVELFLYSNNGNVGLPVPKYFWKMVYDEESKEGVAFMGVNNPFIEETDLDGLELCEDIIRSIEWVTKGKDDLRKGFIFACSIEDFRKIVNYAPKLNIDSILT